MIPDLSGLVYLAIIGLFTVVIGGLAFIIAALGWLFGFWEFGITISI